MQSIKGATQVTLLWGSHGVALRVLAKLDRSCNYPTYQPVSGDGAQSSVLGLGDISIQMSGLCSSSVLGQRGNPRLSILKPWESLDLICVVLLGVQELLHPVGCCLALQHRAHLVCISCNTAHSLHGFEPSR